MGDCPLEKIFLRNKGMLLSDGKIAHWSKPFLCGKEMLLSEGENVHWNTFFNIIRNKKSAHIG